MPPQQKPDTVHSPSFSPCLYDTPPSLDMTYGVGDTGTLKTHLSIALAGAVATPRMNFADLSTVHGQVVYVP